MGIPIACQQGEYKNIAPRVGFAWDPWGDGKTSIRAAVGVFYDGLNGNEAGAEATQGGAPFAYSSSLSNLNNWAEIGVGGGNIAPVAIEALSETSKFPRTYQWNFNIQRQFTPNDLLTVAYVGSAGNYLTLERDINLVPLGLSHAIQDQIIDGADTYPYVPYQGFRRIGVTDQVARSNYNSLQASFRHQVGSGLNFGVNYTWSHAIDNAGSQYERAHEGVDEYNLNRWRGNSSLDRGPRPDILKNVRAHDADLLFFSGDQVYDHGKHLASWLVFGRQFGEITRDRPTITVPDDHDVGQSNLWGEGGKVSKLESGPDGGYFRDAEFVKEVERAQTWHLPDPVDPTPVAQGIGVYYTSMTVGGIGFAIIEDRKWKSGPAGKIPQMGPRPDHINDPTYDPKAVDVPGLELLGPRQEKFLEAWARDWAGHEMKAVLTQTVFANAALRYAAADRLWLAVAPLPYAVAHSRSLTTLIRLWKALSGWRISLSSKPAPSVAGVHFGMIAPCGK